MLARAAKSDGKYSKIVTLFTTLVLAMSGLVLSPAHATAPSDGTYLCTSGEASSSTPHFSITNGVVTNGVNCAGAVVVPEGVTSIGAGAFQYAELTSINIPAGVTSIGEYAFSETALTSITIPASVTSIGERVFYLTSILKTVIFESDSVLRGIGDYAFYAATALTSITIPAGVTSIGEGAFNSAESLTSITIPAGVTSIGDGAFSGALSLTSVYFLGDAPTTGTAGFDWVANGAKAYIKSGATGFGSAGASWNGLVVDIFAPDGAYVCTTGEPLEASSSASNFTITSGVVTNGGSCEGAVVIPEGVTSIGEYAFWNAQSLTSITIPASVTSIDDYAFYGSALASIAIPASVTSIGDDAFQNARSLASITVADANANYSAAAGVLFNKYATTLRLYPRGKADISFTIPASVTSIGDDAFAYATKLTSITIPAGVTSIGVNAFYEATALTTVTFESGSNLTSIGVNAFYEATALTSIAIPASVTSIGVSAFYYATSLNTVTFGTGSKLTSISEYAFEDATSLTSITIPASVTSIGEGAFANATALTSVYFLGNAPTTVGDAVGDAVFDGVATGAKAYKKSGATGFDLDTDGDENSGVWYGLVVTIGVYTVTYNTSGGSAVTAQNYGANIATPTSPTRTGYTFAGWSRTSGGSAITFPHTPASAGDITLYAKWTQNPARAQATVKPTVSGTAKVSKTLTANKGTWTGYPTPSAFTYQWYSCTKQVNAATQTIPSTCKSISKATKSTLAVTSSFKGKYLAVTVTGTSTGTSATKWLSKSTTIVQ